MLALEKIRRELSCFAGAHPWICWPFASGKVPLDSLKLRDSRRSGRRIWARAFQVHQNNPIFKRVSVPLRWPLLLLAESQHLHLDDSCGSPSSPTPCPLRDDLKLKYWRSSSISSRPSTGWLGRDACFTSVLEVWYEKGQQRAPSMRNVGFRVLVFLEARGSPRSHPFECSLRLPHKPEAAGVMFVLVPAWGAHRGAAACVK